MLYYYILNYVEMYSLLEALKTTLKIKPNLLKYNKIHLHIQFSN